MRLLGCYAFVNVLKMPLQSVLFERIGQRTIVSKQKDAGRIRNPLVYSIIHQMVSIFPLRDDEP